MVGGTEAVVSVAAAAISVSHHPFPMFMPSGGAVAMTLSTGAHGAHYGLLSLPSLSVTSPTTPCHPSEDSVSKSKKKVQVIIAAAVSVCVLAVILALTGFFFWKRKRTKARSSVETPSKWSGVLHSRTLHSEGTSHGADLDLPIYNLETIAAATEGFSAENKLGEGGWASIQGFA